MATLSPRDTKGMYSWWWNSHITPKNSKWLQENLTGMDFRVKQMIKLLEEDADTFAKKAEMYYKKRPELMKLVEEFYRAYRALAERYDNATGVIRQAHRTMAEAFPNQVPLILVDDAPAGTADYDPHTPEILPPTRALVYPGELQKDDADPSSSHFHNIKRNSAVTEDYDSVTSRKGLRHINDLSGSGEAGYLAKFGEGRVRKGLNFHDVEENEGSADHNGNRDLKARTLPQSEQVAKTEAEIMTLRKALAKLEAEKEADLLQYQQILERLSKLESEVSHAKEDSLRHSERASKAEAEVQTLEEALAKFQAEKEASLLHYRQCLDKISNLESNISHMQSNTGELNERAGKAEAEADILKQDLDRAKAEMEVGHVQCEQSLERISNLEDKLVHAEEVARKTSELADKAEREVEILKQALTKMTEEKEATALHYQQCLESISALESKIVCAEEAAQRLTYEIDNRVAKLKGAEERCLLLEKLNQTMQTELESTMQKMGTQSQELTEKQQELEKLRTSIQEECLHFGEVQTGFQTLKYLHSQSQVELRSLDVELQSRAQILKDMEIHNQSLVDEVQKLKEENNGLNELNLSSALSIKDLQDGILSLRETLGKLEVEVGQRVDQNNALQQEIYHLKEELSNLTKKHLSMVEQITTVGLDPELIGSSVKELQDENAKLNQISEGDRREKVVLLEKLEIMEKLLEKNALLEKSLSVLYVEIEGLREKVKALEESCQSLLEEKSTIVSEKVTLNSQLQIATDTKEKLLEKSNFMENLLSDTNAELEGLRVKSKCLEDSSLLLSNEKSCLITKREQLDSQLGITQQMLEDLERKYTELEEKYSGLEIEREFKLCEVEELQVSLDAEKKEYASFAHLSETRLAGLESQIHLLQEEGQCRNKEYEEELEKAISAQFEIFILQKCLQDSEKKNVSLFVEYQKLLESFKFSNNVISELERATLEQQVEVKSLCDQIKALRMGLYRVLKILNIDVDHDSEDKIAQDLIYLNRVLDIFEESQKTLSETWDENQQLFIEMSVLLTLVGQLRLEAGNLTTERNTLHQEFEIRSEQLLVLDNEMQKLKQMNEEVRLQVMEGHHKEELLTTENESIQGKLLSLHEAYHKLQEENSEACKEKRSLTKEVLSLEEDRIALEEESCDLIGKTISLENLSGILKDVVSEKYLELKEHNEHLDRLCGVNDGLEQKLRTLEEKLETVQVENSHLKESLEKTDNELKLVRFVGDQLTSEVANGKDLLCQKENELLEAKQKLGAVQNEVELLESQAAAFFGELQISTIQDALFEGKIHELAEAYQDLESSSTSKGTEIDHLKGRVGTLEGESVDLKSHLAAYIPAINSLTECVSSLENQIILQTKSQRAGNAEAKDGNLVSHLQAQSLPQTNHQISTEPDEIINLQELQTRISAVERAMIDMELKSGSSSHSEIAQISNTDVNVPKPMPAISGNEFLTKDIMLDQESESSSYGISKRRNVYEPTDCHEIEEIKEHMPVEKELSVDKLEISQRFTESYQEENKKKILQRLDSDLQKLANLQTTVQDLKTKVDHTETSKKQGNIKFDTVKGQLEETEDAIMKLLAVNTKLIKKVEGGPSLSDRRSSLQSDEFGSSRRSSRVSEQARRGSEQIGRIQMELQKIQFLLMKLDNQKTNKGRTGITDRKTRVLLKDYIYGGARNNHKITKACCALSLPATKDD